MAKQAAVLIDAKSGEQLSGRVAGITATNRATAAAPSCSIAAPGAADTRLIINSIFASIAAAGTAQTPVGVRLRDGVGGTILWEGVLSAPINQAASVGVDGADIPISLNGVAVLEFDAALAAAVQGTVSLVGYHAVWTP